MLHAKLFFYHPSLPYHSILWTNSSTLIHPFGRGLVFFFFQSLFYHPSLLYQSMLLGGGGCCMPNFSFIILHCSVSHTTRTNTLPFLTPLGGGWFYIHLYIHKFLSRIYSIILHVSPTPNLKKCHSTTDSFLKGLNSLYISIVSFIILHCSISPCFWEGVDVACQTFHLLSCIALSFHCARKKTPLPLFTPLGGDWYYTYIYTYFSFKNLFYHPSLLYQPMLLGGVDVACQTVRLSSCIALSFHTTRESSYSTLIHPFAGFLDIFLSRNSSIILHSIYPCFWEGGGCCMPNSLFILHCPVISNY